MDKVLLDLKWNDDQFLVNILLSTFHLKIFKSK